MKHIRYIALLLLFACRLPVSAEMPSFTHGSGVAPAFDSPIRDQITFTDPGFDDTLYPVSVNNWWGYMNQRGQLVVFPRFAWADDFYDGLARATMGEKTGYIKGNGDWVHEPIYPDADRFAEGRAIVGDGEYFGYIEKSGKLIVPVKLDGALRFNEGVAGVMKDGLCGFINLSGGLEVPLRYTRIRSYHEGLAAFARPNPSGGPDAVGYLDRRGRETFTDQSGRITVLGDFYDGLARFKTADDKWGYLGRNFRPRIDAQFDDARDFTNGVAAVRVGEKWGFIDKTGKLAIQPVYDAADDMDDPLAMVTQDKLVGYVNRNASQGVTPQFTEGRPYRDSYARVYVEPSFGYIDRAGNPIWDPRQALKGFINKSVRERAAIASVEEIVHNRTIEPPAFREPITPPYPPDYTYEDVLPRPQR
jgi:hypothetical protein